MTNAHYPAAVYCIDRQRFLGHLSTLMLTDLSHSLSSSTMCLQSRRTKHLHLFNHSLLMNWWHSSFFPGFFFHECNGTINIYNKIFPLYFWRIVSQKLTEPFFTRSSYYFLLTALGWDENLLTWSRVDAKPLAGACCPKPTWQNDLLPFGGQPLGVGLQDHSGHSSPAIPFQPLLMLHNGPSWAGS